MAKQVANLFILIVTLAALSALIFEAESGYEGGGARCAPRARSGHAWHSPKSSPEPSPSIVGQPPSPEAVSSLAIGIAAVLLLAGLLVYKRKTP